MAGYIESTRTSVVKLNNNNYHLWKFGAEMLLLKEDLWEVVTSNKPDKITDDWTKKDNSARATIALSTDANLHGLISECSTSKEMWYKIKKHFERASYSSRIFLKRKLYATKLENYDMEGYIGQILGIVERLLMAGETIDDKEVISMLLCGLNEDYDSLIMAIEGKNEGDNNLEDIKIKLRDEAKRKEEKLNISVEHHALAANMNRQDRYGQRQIKLCYECRAPGHLRLNCPRLRKNNEETNKNRNQFIRKTEMPINSKRTDNETSYYTGAEENKEEVSESFYSYITISEHAEQNLSNDKMWVLDSGATTHMCNNIKWIDEYSSYKYGKTVIFANGNESKVMGEGELNYINREQNKIGGMNMGRVIYVPSVIINLMSVPELCSLGYKVIFNKNNCEIMLQDKIVLSGGRNRGIYEVTLESNNINMIMTACVHKWHARMGHRNLNGIKKLNNKNVKGLKIDKCKHDDKCEICDVPKLNQKSYENSLERQVQNPFSLLHSDVCGPITPKSLGGDNYFVVIIDDYSRYCYLKIIKHKSETESVIKNFIDHFFNKFKYYPQFLRSDCGGEYESNELNTYLKNKGIVHQKSIGYHHEQNGVVERVNRKIVTMIKGLLNHHKLKKELWGEAAATVCYLYNRSVHSYTQEIPYVLWTGKIPDLGHLKIMGSKVIYWIPKQLRSKLSNNGRVGVLLGYGENIKAYKILDQETNKIVYSRTVRFNEEDTHRVQNEEEENEELEILLPTNKQNPDARMETELRRSTRFNLGTKPKRYEL